MVKGIFYFVIIFIYLTFKTYADFSISEIPKSKANVKAIGLFNEGILFGSNENTYLTGITNGLLFDSEGNLNYEMAALKGFYIEDLKSDKDYFYAATKTNNYGQIGLFRIKKDFSEVSNIGLKAATTKILPFKNKVYTGGTVHGCYVVNKDGSSLVQILGDGYFGPYIDDLKANSSNVFINSRGQIYKVDYESNTYSQILTTLRPSSFEVDDERIYLSTGYQFFHLSFDGKSSNQRFFPNNINFIKKYKNYIFVVESSSISINFWVSKDYGNNFYKSKYSMPAAYQITKLELSGDNPITVLINTNGYGIFKGIFTFDLEDEKIFLPPFSTSKPEDLLDKITSYFDHKYPYLGNKTEEQEFLKTTLNFDGKDLPQPYLYYSSHDGIDFGLNLNTPIYSVYEGKASYFFQDKGLGHAIQISHPNGYITVYGHLSEEDLITKDSTYVYTNQKIGKVGMSGNTNGPHLHFTVYKGSKVLENKLDPFGWNSKNLDPWEIIGTKSKYLWNQKPKPESKQINLSKENIFQNQNLLITNKIVSKKQPLNFEITKNSPIFDQKNFLYLKDTSYNLKLTNFEIEQLNPNEEFKLSFEGFQNFEDEKNYSFWKYEGNLFKKEETVFNPQKKSLETTTTISDSQIMILKNNYKKIKTSSSFLVN